jgi:hypothetical protein
MGGHGDRPPAGRTGTDSAAEPAGSGPGAAAAQRPSAGPGGLEGALHGAPDLLAALAMPGDRSNPSLRLVSKGRARTDSAEAGSGPGAAAAQRPAAGPGLEDALHGAPDLLPAVVAGGGPGDLPSHTLRRVSKACREAVDGATTHIRLDFEAGLWAAGFDTGQRAAWHERVACRLAMLPCLAELTYVGYGANLERLLARAAAAKPGAMAGVQRLKVDGQNGLFEADWRGPGLPALLRLLAHLPSLQARAVGWPEACLCEGFMGEGRGVCLSDSDVPVPVPAVIGQGGVKRGQGRLGHENITALVWKSHSDGASTSNFQPSVPLHADPHHTILPSAVRPARHPGNHALPGAGAAAIAGH